MRLRYGNRPDELDLLEPLWGALQEHHAEVLPILGNRHLPRSTGDSWTHRRAKYERWLGDPDTFFVVAEEGKEAVGYAFVTIGPGYASWQTGRLAELETLSVLPNYRGRGLGGELMDAVWSKLAQRGVTEMAITTALTNVDSHRFYERQGFRQSFVIYYAERPD
jgi:ribosomal protein S18 acetylase RimI-like enzyme